MSIIVSLQKESEKYYDIVRMIMPTTLLFETTIYFLEKKARRVHNIIYNYTVVQWYYFDHQ